MIEKESIFKAWTIDLHERFPHWPYKKPKPGHEGFRLLDGPAPDFRRMTVEEFETLPAGVWMDVKKALPPLEHPVLTVDAYGNYHTRTEYTEPRRSRSASPTTTAVSGRRLHGASSSR